jgi:hypothetical protein
MLVFGSRQETVFRQLIGPLIDEAEKRRRQRNSSDPEYHNRVEPTRNQNRLQCLVFCSTETWEPPRIDQPGHYIASPTIVSLDYLKGVVDIISASHDIYAPEIDKALGTFGQPKSAHRIDQAQKWMNPQVGGFEMSQILFENMTGLAIDFQIHFKSETIQAVIDQLYGGLTVDLPQDIPLQAYFFKGQLYDSDCRTFPKGLNQMSGREVVGFMAAIAKYGPWDPEYSPIHEHNERKNLLAKALLSATQEKISSPSFWLAARNLFEEEIDKERLALDFDHGELLMATALNILPALGFSWINQLEAGLPTMGYQEYLVDNESSKRGKRGDRSNIMPVHYKDWTAPNEEGLIKAKGEGIFDPAIDYMVPYGANPYDANLANGYWGQVREYIGQIINREIPPL